MDDGTAANGISRRRFVGVVAGLTVSVLPGCRAGSRRESDPPTGGEPQPASRLAARPGRPPSAASDTGLLRLGLDSDRDGFVFVPSAASSGAAHPLILMLHGAGGNGRAGLAPFLDGADEAGVILVAPDSRRRTWDAIGGSDGPDVAFLDRALAQTFERYAVDPRRVGVEGFSDGASYALGIGLANGDLFSRLIAFSPGFSPEGRAVGRPDVFISHGTGDDVLPIDRCSRRIVPWPEDGATTSRTRSSKGATRCPPPSPPKPWPGSGARKLRRDVRRWPTTPRRPTGW